MRTVVLLLTLTSSTWVDHVTVPVVTVPRSTEKAHGPFYDSSNTPFAVVLEMVIVSESLR